MGPDEITEVCNATYSIFAQYDDGTEVTGTGFCYFLTGRIMTCSHVVSRIVNGGIETAGAIIASRLVNGETVTYPAVIIKNGRPDGPLVPTQMNDPDTLDLAILQIDTTGNVPSILFAGNAPAIGQPCTAFQAVEDDEDEVDYNLSGGNVTNVWNNAHGTTALVRSSCPMVLGYSGGPLVDNDASVIGVNVLADPNNPNWYSIAAAIAWDFIPDGA